MKIIKKIERSRSILEVLEDTKGDRYYSKSFDNEQMERLKSKVRNDYASIQFLSQIPSIANYVPKFHSGNNEIPSFIMTDVGTGQQLDEVLMEANAVQAEKALIGLLKTLATVHKETIGKEIEYSTSRKALGKYYERSEGIEKIPDFIKFTERTSTYLGIDFESQVIEKEIKEIFYAVFKSEKLQGLTHWDPCPDNCKMVDDIVKIYDFECASYSNVLIDGLYLSTRFPSCWCVADIPKSVVDKAEKEYRKILSQKVPEINDDAFFMKQKSIIMTYWFLKSIYYDLERSIERDATWGIATMRQRILLRLELTTNTLKEDNSFPGLLNLFDKLNSKLSKEWEKDENMKMYNAFLKND